VKHKFSSYKMGDCSSKLYENDEDDPSPRRVQYTRSRLTTLTGQKLRAPIDKDIWTKELIDLVKNYKEDTESTVICNLSATANMKGIHFNIFFYDIF
jgi:hypothetical protein